MRHGQAANLTHAMTTQQDSQRPLTDLGHQQARTTGQWIAENYTVDAVLASPYKRAQQTWQGVQTALGELTFFETTADITPEGDAHFVVDYLEALMMASPDCQTWLLVSHMPLVSYLTEQLGCLSAPPMFATASVAVIEYDEQKGRGQLVTHYFPTI